MKHILLACTLSSACALGVFAQDQDAKAPAGNTVNAKKKKEPKQSDAEKYAAELSKLLVEYQKQLSNKITAEQRAYSDAAKLYDDAFRTDAFASLSLDRTEDAQHAQRALQAKTLTPDQLLEDVAQYAQHDFNQTRSIYQLGIDSYRTYLSNLNSLEADSQKIGALAKALNDLAKPAKLLQRVADLKSYQESLNKQLHFSDCSLSDSLLDINKKKKSAIDDRVKKIDAQISALAPGGDAILLQKQKQELQQEAASLKTQADRLQAQRDNSGGFSPGPTPAAGKCEVK